MPSYDVGNVSINAEVGGEGFPLLLISGTGLPMAVWAFHTGWLSEMRKVIAVDNRDVGGSGAAEDEYSPSEMAADALGVLDAVGVERTDVIGFSLGGAIAQELVLSAPERVRGLVLYATWPSTDDWLRLRFSAWERITASVPPDVVTDLGALDMYTHRFFEDPARLEMLRAAARATAAERRPDGLARQWRADQRHDAAERLRTIESPTLVVVGEEDVLVPPRYSAALTELIGGARLEVIPQAGHGALIERPDAFRHAIEPFLRDLA